VVGYFDTVGAVATVADEFGQLWSLERQIGSGGQGQVWLAAGGRIAVKVAGRMSGQAEAAAVHGRLRRVRRLPLEGIRIAGVDALLAPPRIGYTMQLAGEMFELSQLQHPPPGADFEIWYRETGGLARRLRLMARLADAIARLHARGIAFQDLAPGNVMVSRAVEHDEVLLIDVDNLAVRSTFAEPAVYTPGYGAPEVVSGASGATTSADAHALATIVFETLTTVHPFRGDLVVDGPPETEEDQANRYLLPWVDHVEDRRNATDYGLVPRDELLSARLRTLFERAFVDGLADPYARPSSAEWASALYSAADQSVACSDCGWSFRASAINCFACGRPRQRVLVLRYMMDLGRGLMDDADEDDGGTSSSGKLPEFTVLDNSEETRILARHAAFVPTNPEALVAGMALSGDWATITNYSRGDLWIDRGNGAGPVAVSPGATSTTRISELGEGWELHFGRPGSTHRWAVVNML